MNLRSASITDLEGIKELLIVSNLPTDDITEYLDRFIVCEEEEKIIGVGGLEVHGKNALVRSISVMPKSQRKGIGKLIYKSIEHMACRLGVTTLYLLTETAEEYFELLGFAIMDRADVPKSIKNSKQFSFLCPSTAKLMFRRLPDYYER